MVNKAFEGFLKPFWKKKVIYIFWIEALVQLKQSAGKDKLDFYMVWLNYVQIFMGK